MDIKTRNAYVSMMIYSISHNLARYHAGLVPFSTPIEYKAALIKEFKEYGISNKLYRIWLKKADVRALAELDIIRDNKDLQSNGGSAITAEALVGPYLSFLGYKKKQPVLNK